MSLVSPEFNRSTLQSGVHGEMQFHSRDQHIVQLDEPDAFHQPKGFVEHSLGRVRRVRRVDLQFIAPPLFPKPFPRVDNISVRRIFWKLEKGPRWAAPPFCPRYLLRAPKWQLVERILTGREARPYLERRPKIRRIAVPQQIGDLLNTELS